MARSADQLIEDEYAQLQGEVQRTVAAKLNAGGIRLSSHDLEGAYNEAWHALYMALQEGQEIENRTGYLVTVAYRRALKEFEASKWTRRSDQDIDQLATSLDLDAQLDAEMQIRHVEEGFRSKLSERELQAASLCLIHGYTRPEAAKLLGISPKRMEKVMDKASGKISGVVESVRGGTHCDELNSTIKAFALGLLDSEGDRYKLASDHLESCPACRREVWTVRGLAAVAPPIPVAFALLSAGAGAGGGTTAGGTGAAQSGSTASAGASSSGSSASGGAAGPQTAVVGAVVAAVAVAGLVAAGLATGFIGTPGGSGGDSKPTTAAGQTSSSAVAAAAKAAKQARNQQAQAAAKRKAQKARAKAKAARHKSTRAAEAAALAAAQAEAESTYEPADEVYVPPPPPPEPVTVEPDPKPDPPKPKPERPKPEPRPTTDADEEFGVVGN